MSKNSSNKSSTIQSSVVQKVVYLHQKIDEAKNKDYDKANKDYSKELEKIITHYPIARIANEMYNEEKEKEKEKEKKHKNIGSKPPNLG